MIRFPKSVEPAEINAPAAMVETTMTMAFLAFMGSSSSFKYMSVSTGLMTRATNREEPSTIIRVMGSQNINSPMIPGQTTNGRKAARVVAVEEMIGHAT